MCPLPLTSRHDTMAAGTVSIGDVITVSRVRPSGGERTSGAPQTNPNEGICSGSDQSIGNLEYVISGATKPAPSRK